MRGDTPRRFSPRRRVAGAGEARLVAAAPLPRHGPGRRAGPGERLARGAGPFLLLLLIIIITDVVFSCVLFLFFPGGLVPSHAHGSSALSARQVPGEWTGGHRRHLRGPRTTRRAQIDWVSHLMLLCWNRVQGRVPLFRPKLSTNSKSWPKQKSICASVTRRKGSEGTFLGFSKGSENHTADLLTLWFSRVGPF